MNVAVIAVGLVALFAFPLVVYGVIWLTSRTRNSGRPEPPETNNPQRNIPGQDGD